MKRSLTALAAASALALAAAAGEPPPVPEIPVALPVDDQPAPLPTAAHSGAFRHVGTFVVQAHIKITDDRVTRLPIKPITMEVHTNGLELRVSAAGHDEATAVYQIYRSDGISRLNPQTGVLEVIPGLQGSSCRDGALRHVRVTRETLTITQFAGISNQTLITHAVAAATPPANTGATTAGHAASRR